MMEWELNVTDSPLLLTLAYVFPSVLGGIGLVVCGALVWILVAALARGNVERVAWVVVGMVLALFSGRYLPALFGTHRPDALRERYTARGLLVGSVCGAVVILGAARLHPAAPFALFVGSWLPLVFTAAFPTSGHADGGTGSLVVDGTEVPLGAVRHIRSVTLGVVAVCWLAYERGVPRAPRIVVLPAEIVETTMALVDSASASAGEERSPMGRSERLVAVTFGLGLIAVGPALWLVLPPGDGRGVALVAGALFGLFGAVLLRHAGTG
jgi:hypothetical protein